MKPRTLKEHGSDLANWVTEKPNPFHLPAHWLPGRWLSEGDAGTQALSERMEQKSYFVHSRER